MEELIPTLQEEGEERIDTLQESAIIAGVQTINGKAGDLNLKTINNVDLLTSGNLNLATSSQLTAEAQAREQADNTLQTTKQDKLVAGSNIQIASDGKTISATDTTYSAGSGLDLTGTTFSVDTTTIATQDDIHTLQSTKQDNLTQTQLTAVNSGIDSTKVGQIATNTSDISTINGKIPAQASPSNQLADKSFVNSSVQTATANFRGSWDDWADVPSDASEYPEDYAGSTTPTVNDYLVIQDASDYTEETLEGTWRFKYTGNWATEGKTGWIPEYQVNETPLTSDQLKALNSGITDTLVAQISTNQNDIASLSSGKMNANTTFWGQSVQNGAVGGTLTLTESGQNATIATSGHNTTDAGIKMGNSKNYVEAGVSTVTLSSTTGNIQLKPKSGSSVDVMSSKITNLATPTANTDASTKKYVDDGLATKQNTLTAGTNISISGDTISATDTTYTAGTGLTLTGTEFSANDPAPSGFFTGSSSITATGSTLSLSGTGEFSFKDVQIKGDTTQQSYTGKNLFNYLYDSFPISKNGLTYTLNDNGSITLTGVPSANYVKIDTVNITSLMEEGATYTLSQTDNSNHNFYVEVRLTKIGSGYEYYNPAEGTQNFTWDTTKYNGAQIYASIFTMAQWGTSSRTITQQFQLEKGSPATAFEPYVGGSPSPSTSYPQNINAVKGDQRVGITGKNILDQSQFVQGTLNGDSGTEGASTTRLRSPFTLLPGSGTYTVSNNNGFYIAVYIYNENQNFLSGESQTHWVEATSYTFTVTNGKYARILYRKTNSATITPSELTTAQLEKGSTPTTYEQYSGANYTISLGKNLFNKNLAMEYKWINATTGLITDSSDKNVVSPLYHLEVGKTYTISGIGSLEWNLFSYMDSSFSNPVRRINNSTSIRSYTAVTPWCRFAIGGGDAIAIKDNIQFELGSTATSFEPYVEPLCKLGTYEDYIYKSSGKWYRHEAVGKVVYDGSVDESWSKYNATSTRTGGYYIAKPDAISASPCLCDQFINQNTESPWYGGVGTFRISSSLNAIFETTPIGGTTPDLSDWTTALASKNLTLYYPLATPTDTEITDSALVAQLEALWNAKLADGTTNITATGVRPNLDAILTVEAFKNNWAGTNAGYSAEIAKLEARVTALEGA